MLTSSSGSPLPSAPPHSPISTASAPSPGSAGPAASLDDLDLSADMNLGPDLQRWLGNISLDGMLAEMRRERPVGVADFSGVLPPCAVVAERLQEIVTERIHELTAVWQRMACAGVRVDDAELETLRVGLRRLRQEVTRAGEAREAPLPHWLGLLAELGQAADLALGAGWQSSSGKRRLVVPIRNTIHTLVALQKRLLHFGVAAPTAEALAQRCADWPPASAQEVSAVVAGLAHVNDRAALVAALQRAMSDSRRRLCAENTQAWLALLRPELFGEWFGLDALLPAVLAAHARHAQQRPPERGGNRYLDTLLVEAMQGLQLPKVQAFAWRFRSPLLNFLALQIRDAPPLPRRPHGAPEPATSRDAQSARVVFPRHARAIHGLINGWAQRGLPTHISELACLMVDRGVPVSERRLHQLPQALAGIESSGAWFFPAGQAPRRPVGFKLTSDGAQAFRGPAILPVADGVPAAPEGGCCQALLRLGRGFTSREAGATVATQGMGFSGSKRSSCVQSWIHSGILVPLSPGLWVIEPDILCASAREAMLRTLPPRAEWHGNLPPSARRLRPLVAKQARRAPGARHEPLKGRLVLTMVAKDARAIFGYLEELRSRGTLDTVLRIDGAGCSRFNFPALKQAMQPMYPGAMARMFHAVLAGLDPEDLDQALAVRQWTLPRLPFAAMPDALAALGQTLPLYYLLPRCHIAQLINVARPKYYCDAASLSIFLAGMPEDLPAAERELRAVLAQDRTASRFFGAGTTNIDRPGLVNYLASLGIGLRFPNLQKILQRVPVPFRERVGQFRRIDALRSPRGRAEAARAVASGLGLEAGSPLPDWSVFEPAFEAGLAGMAARRAPAGSAAETVVAFYSGEAATLVYLHLRRVLKAGELPFRPADDAEAGARAEAPATEPAATPKRTRVAAPPPRQEPLPALAVLQRATPARTGLAGLHHALCNLLQDTQPGPVPEALQAFAADGAAPPDHLVRPAAALPAGDWQLLWLDAVHFNRLALLLLDQIDLMLVSRASAQAAGEQEFVAVRRRGTALFTLSGIAPVVLPGRQAQRLLGTAGDHLSAALPTAACRGLVSQCISYSAVPGFLGACDALADLLGVKTALPVLATWLDQRLGLDPQAGHRSLHAARLGYYPAVQAHHVALLAGERGGMALRAGPPLPAIEPQDDARAFVRAVEAQVQRWPAGNRLLLQAPLAPGIVLLRQCRGDIEARVRERWLPWRSLVQEALPHWRARLAQAGGTWEGLPQASMFVPAVVLP